MNLRVLVLPGDGIGTEVTREAVRVLRYVAGKWNHPLHIAEGLLGDVECLRGRQRDRLLQTDEARRALIGPGQPRVRES